MKLTNAQILESVQILAKAEEKGFLGFVIAQNRRKLLNEVEDYSVKRDELLQKHGTDLGDGRFTLKAENLAAFEAELRPYAEMEVDVSVVQVEPDVFCSGDLTSSQMYALGWMVKGDD